MDENETKRVREERIRVRAHEIWEHEGKPHGRHGEHWRQAEEEIDAEASDGRIDPDRAADAAPAQRAAALSAA